MCHYHTLQNVSAFNKGTLIWRNESMRNSAFNMHEFYLCAVLFIRSFFIILISSHPKLAQSRSGWRHRSDRCPSTVWPVGRPVADPAMATPFWPLGLTGLTGGPRVRVELKSPSKFRVVKWFVAGQDLPPYKYKGPRPFEGESPNWSLLSTTFISQTLAFPTLCFPCLSRRWSGTFWVALPTSEQH
jgi:hypothetical protein